MGLLESDPPHQPRHCQQSLLGSGCLKIEGIDLTMMVEVAGESVCVRSECNEIRVRITMCVLPTYREQNSVWIAGENLHRIGDISAEFGRVGRHLSDKKKMKNTR